MSSSERSQRASALAQAVKEYVTKEKERIDKEVEILQKILDGRTGGKGLSTINLNQISAVAQKDLEAYLTPK